MVAVMVIVQAVGLTNEQHWDGTMSHMTVIWPQLSHQTNNSIYTKLSILQSGITKKFISKRLATFFLIMDLNLQS